MKNKTKKQLSQRDLEFMHSLSEAVLQMTPKKIQFVLYFWLFAIVAFLLWANFAYIDEIARGEGEVIPSGHNQMVQNLEGGIVEEILVKEGEEVQKGQVLLKIDNQKSESSYSSSTIKAQALQAKIARLEAQTQGKEFKVGKGSSEFMKNEEVLFQKSKQQLQAKLQGLESQLDQKTQELKEAESSLGYLKNSLDMVTEELQMTRPMVARGVKSKVDFLKLQREANEAQERYNATKLSIPRVKSAVQEIEENIKELTLTYKLDAQEQLNEVKAELEEILASSVALKDQVSRTLVRSPMKGVVQTLFVNTVGGVIRPADNIVEIVPSEQTLLIEVKVKPSDIAFIYYGQKAIVKFSAYDFAIYGGLEGKVVHISADTIKDEKENVFYSVRIKTEQNYLERKGHKHKIIPGMVANVDIITGQKTVLDYILKPILKTKQYTFSER